MLEARSQRLRLPDVGIVDYMKKKSDVLLKKKDKEKPVVHQLQSSLIHLPHHNPAEPEQRYQSQ